MNQHLHRIIFNAARGCLMAVAETSRANGKSASAERGAPHRNARHTRGFQPSSLQWVCWLAVGALVVNHTSPVVWAQTTVMADPTAPRNQQPTVLRAGNSTVQVNIQTPNAAGLSRNNYKQFDILADGVILNNSRTQTNTNLGGWIEANPWLAKGTAKVILNQVNSIHPSLLKGPVEVAGQRADVIIANPAGISVNGGSFINASQVHLTTGTPEFENNQLKRYQVKGGTVEINGLGLDTSQADYTAILSRAVLLNAKVWANDLKVVTGINDITVDSVITQVQPNSTADSAASAPAFALDVSQLGGMYAGKIQLIGTEAGLGVRNAGTLQASQGPLEVSQDGWLSNAGSLRANQTLNIRTTGKIDNSGSAYAAGAMEIVSSGTQTHSGVTAALGSVHLQTIGDPKADIVSTPQALIAAGIQADGKFIQAQPLNLQADGQVQLAGETLTMGALQMKGESIDLSHAKLAAQQAMLVATQGDLNVTSSQIQVQQNLSLQTPKDWVTDHANITIDTLDLTAGNWRNLGGDLTHLSNRNLNLSLDRWDNSGSVVSNGNMNIHTRQFNNSGTVFANADLTTETGALNNQGALIARGSQHIQAETLTATNTSLIAAGMNGEGKLQALDKNPAQLRINTTQTLQSAGQVLAYGDIQLSASSIDLQHSQTATQTGGISLTATQGDINTSHAKVSSPDHIAINANQVNGQALINQSGSIIGDSFTLALSQIDNTQGSILQTGNKPLDINLGNGNLWNTQGKLVSAGSVNIQSGWLNNDLGLIGAYGNIQLQTRSFSNQEGTLQSVSPLGKSLNDTSTNSLNIELQGDYTTQGNLRSTGNLNLKTTGKLTNNQSLYAGNDLTLSANDIENQANGEFNSGNNTSITADNEFINRGLVDGAHTQINSKSLTNLGTGRIYGDRISIAADTLTNKEETIDGVTSAATIASRNELDIGVKNLINQEHALIYSDGNMAIAGELDTNRRAKGAAFTITNSSATIEAGKDLSITSNTLVNQNLHYVIENKLVTSTPQSTYTGSGNDYTIVNFTRNIYKDLLMTSDPAKLIAGSQLNISTVEGINDFSHMITSGTQTFVSKNIKNLEPRFTSTTVDDGVASHTWRYWVEWGAGIGEHRWKTVNSPYHTTQTITIPNPQSFQTTSNNKPESTQANANTQLVNNSNIFLSNLGLNKPVTTTNTAPTPTPPIVSTQKVNISPVLEVRSIHLPQNVPNTSLYKTRPEPTAKYLVETDPKFTQLKTWLSSDFMLQRLSFDPAMSQKRMGDGFYEQKLVREQVAQLTGRRFIGDFTSDEAQYQALMNNGLTTAKALNLRPGVALSDAQVALLTSDMVWLVEQSVTLPDGSKQSVLVPRLYVRVKPGDLDGSGSLIAADTLNMNLSGDLTNTGTIAGRKVMNITAENIQNLGGTLSAGALNAVARLDINNIGGTIEALSSANLVAGRDFNMATTTQSSKTSTQPRPQPNLPFGMLGLGDQQASEFSQTGIDRVAALYVKNPGGTLSIQTGRDINLTATKVDSQGSATLQAGNDITLGTVTTERTTNINFDANNYNRSSSSKDVGSSITAGNNLSMNAGNDLTAKAANVQAGGALNVNAGNDIIILAGEDKQSNSNASKSTSSGFLSSSTTTRQNSSASNNAIASSFAGKTTEIVADNNLVSVGGAFKGADSLLVEGKNEQKFYAAIDQSSSTSHTETHSSFIGISMDNRTHDDAKSQALALGSQLISDKSIQVNVGKSAEFQGTDISSPQTHFSNIDPNNPGSLRLNGAIETTQTMHSDKSETASVWQSQSGGGTTVQNLKQTTINGAATFDKDLQVSVQLPKVVSTSGEAPNPNTDAGSVSDVNQAAVQNQIELLSQQPGLGYLKQLMDGNAATNSNATSSNTPSSTDAANTNATGPKVQWQQVQLAHDNWNYSQQGLTPVGAALLSIAIAAYTGGMGMELLGTTTATATGTVTTLSGVTLGTTTAATAGAAATATTFAAGAALNAGFSALASQAAIAMVNNGGDINKTLQQLGSDQSVKNLLTTMVTAGALQGMNNAFADMSNTTNAGASGSVVSNGQSGAAASGVNGVTTTQTANAFTQNLTRNLTNNLAGAMVDSAINNKPLNADTLANALKSSLITSGMASGANTIGDAAAQGDINAFTQKVAHAVLGCAGGAAMTGNSGGCSAGAVGAAVGEMAADYYMSNQQDPKLSPEQNKANALAFAKVVSAVSGFVTGGGGDNVAAVNVAGTTGANAAQNNYLKHAEAMRLGDLEQKKLSGKCDSECDRDIAALKALDKARNQQLASCDGVSSPDCNKARQDVRSAAADYIRQNTTDLLAGGVTGIYQKEKAETIGLAQGTLDGKALGVAQGVATSLADGALAMGKLLMSVSGSAFGDTQSQLDLRAGAGAAWDMVKDPNNWPQLLGAMSAQDRDKLATAYEKGDGKTVGQILGAQALSLPITGGGVAGTVSKVDKLANALADAGKAGKVEAVVADVAKVADKAPTSPVDIAHTIGGDFNARTGKVTGGHSLLNSDVRIDAIIAPPDVNGVYKANVSIQTPDGSWIAKTANNAENTMFPKTWDAAKIQVQVDSAWNDPNKTVDAISGKWKGRSTSGVEIEGYTNPRATAYPIYKEGK